MNTICMQCGAPVEAGHTFCANCGAPVPNQPQGYGLGTGVPPQPAPAGRNNKVTLIVVAAVLATLLVVGGIAFALRSGGNSSSDSTVPDTIPTTQLERLQQAVSSQVLTTSDIGSLSSNDRRLLRNYIYARHGYIFRDSQLSSYFNGFDWYKGKYTSQEDVQAMFNDVEKRNAQLLSEKPEAPRPAVTPSRSIGPGYHTFIGHCNIREYATSSSYIVGTAENGQSCYVSGERSGQWYWVTLNNGVQGWTHRQNLR